MLRTGVEPHFLNPLSLQLIIIYRIVLFFYVPERIIIRPKRKK